MSRASVVVNPTKLDDDEAFRKSVRRAMDGDGTATACAMQFTELGWRWTGSSRGSWTTTSQNRPASSQP